MPNFTLTFKNEHIIYEQNVKCTAKDYEFNYTHNPSAVHSGSTGTVKGFVTSSVFTPYMTTVGLYNDANELLAVAKFPQPIPLSQTCETNVLVRFDR